MGISKSARRGVKIVPFFTRNNFFKDHILWKFIKTYQNIRFLGKKWEHRENVSKCIYYGILLYFKSFLGVFRRAPYKKIFLDFFIDGGIDVKSRKFSKSPNFTKNIFLGVFIGQKHDFDA